MEFRTLRAFVEVVRQGGFSQAAKTVFATQSTVSKAVRQLEDELGVALFDRIGHRTRLTSAGEVVYPRALRLLAERDNLVAELREVRGLNRGTLRLGLPPVGSSEIFAPLFAAFRTQYPGIEVLLTEHGADRLEEALLSGEIEVGATLLPASDAFDVREIRTEPLVVALPPNHPLATRASVAFEALKDTPFVLFADGFAINRLVSDACARHGVQPQVVARSGNIDFIIELVGAGLGLAFLPRMLADRHRAHGIAFTPIDEPGLEWRLALVWRRDAALSHAARAWLEMTAQHAGDASSGQHSADDSFPVG